MSELTRNELIRYDRQMILPGFGKPSQLKLKDARVLVIGAGGLGCPVLLYLTAAGIGRIGIVDFDRIELSNLHRQILYGTDDVGAPKATVAADKLAAQNPFVELIDYPVMLTEENADELISKYDIVVDGSDNFLTRYLVNDCCVQREKPLVYGSILRYEGQVTIFNFRRSKNLRDLYPEPPDPEDVPSCAEAGVIGALPGIAGSLMASLVVKAILDDEVPVNELLLFSLEKNSWQKIRY